MEQPFGESEIKRALWVNGSSWQPVSSGGHNYYVKSLFDVESVFYGIFVTDLVRSWQNFGSKASIEQEKKVHNPHLSSTTPMVLTILRDTFNFDNPKKNSKCDFVRNERNGDLDVGVAVRLSNYEFTWAFALRPITPDPAVAPVDAIPPLPPAQWYAQAVFLRDALLTPYFVLAHELARQRAHLADLLVRKDHEIAKHERNGSKLSKGDRTPKFDDNAVRAEMLAEQTFLLSVRKPLQLGLDEPSSEIFRKILKAQSRIVVPGHDPTPPSIPTPNASLPSASLSSDTASVTHPPGYTSLSQWYHPSEPSLAVDDNPPAAVPATPTTGSSKRKATADPPVAPPAVKKPPKLTAAEEEALELRRREELHEKLKVKREKEEKKHEAKTKKKPLQFM